MAGGHFITFEGGEGCGKTTQIPLIASYLQEKGISVTTSREPGGTPGAESIRKLLVEGAADKWDEVTETLLFLAARNDHVKKRILPSLSQGITVLCDRFSDSTVVYQGIGKGLGMGFVKELQSLVIGNFKPDLTIILDIDPEIGLQRAASRLGTETRFEGLEMDFHRSIRKGFLKLASEAPERYAVVDARGDVVEVHEAIKARVNQLIGIQ